VNWGRNSTLDNFECRLILVWAISLVEQSEVMIDYGEVARVDAVSVGDGLFLRAFKRRWPIDRFVREISIPVESNKYYGPSKINNLKLINANN
jgi:hypothetical protein